MKRALLLTALWVIAAGGAALAHEIIQNVTRGSAVVVELKTADGSPFSYEQFEVYRKGEDAPYQTGRTDALGRIVFIPDRAATWRVRAFSEDGHGTDFTIEAGPADAVDDRVSSSDSYSRSMKVVLGITVILLVFMIVLRVIRRRSA